MVDKQQTPEKEPAQSQSQPGYTYENPNEGESYQAPDDAEQDDEEDARPRD